jgi:hypothetical protein
LILLQSTFPEEYYLNMNEKLIPEIAAQMREKSTDDLLAIWRANDRNEWSDEAFEAIEVVLKERQVPKSDRGQIESQPLLRELPPSSGYPCIRCGSVGRKLKFTSTRWGYGYLNTRKLEIWTGYMCKQCAWTDTIGSLVAIPIGIFTIHPQALFWVPGVFFGNLTNSIGGIQPDQNTGFRANDIQDGRLTQGALLTKAQIVTPIMEADQFQFRGEAGVLLQAAVLVLAGLQDRAFAERTYKALLEFHDKYLVRRWAKRIEPTIISLGVFPDAVKTAVKRRKTLELPQLQFAASLLPSILVWGGVISESTWLRLFFFLLAFILTPLMGYGLWNIRSSTNVQIPWSIRKKEIGGLRGIGILIFLGFVWLMPLFKDLDGNFTLANFAKSILPKATIPTPLQFVLFAMFLLFMIAQIGMFIVLCLDDKTFKRGK